MQGALEKLTRVDGEELLNLFYHGSVIKRVGDGKEELCHAMWTSLSMYNHRGAEQPCLVLLSNLATYFLTASGDNEAYNISNVKHENLRELCIGSQYQLVRLGGESEQDYYCCITRDPTLVHIFVTRITFIIDTDFVKAPPVIQRTSDSEEEEEESIYDTKVDEEADTGHPSGVIFVYNEEQSLIEAQEFLSHSAVVDVTVDTDIISMYFIHTRTTVSTADIEDALHPCSLILTADTIYLIQEAYVNHPVPKCVQTLSTNAHYSLERTIKLKDITGKSFDKHLLQLKLIVDDEALVIAFCSQTLAEAFLNNYDSLLEG